MIELRERFEVPAFTDAVWAARSPRCRRLRARRQDRQLEEDGALDASVVVKFGPTRVTFRVKANLELDVIEARCGTITAQGRDTIGGTRMRSTARFEVTPGTGRQRLAVAIDGNVEVSGRLASLIEGGASLVVTDVCRVRGAAGGPLLRRAAVGRWSPPAASDVELIRRDDTS